MTLGPNKVLILGPMVLEKVLDLGPKSWKASQIQVIVPRKDPRFRSQVLKKDLDLGPRSYKRSQIQVLGPRFRSQILYIVQDFGLRKILDLASRSQKTFQILVLCPRNVLDCRFQVLGKVLDLGPRVQACPRKGPRLLPLPRKRLDCRFIVTKGHRFRSQVLKKVQIID